MQEARRQGTADRNPSAPVRPSGRYTAPASQPETSPGTSGRVLEFDALRGIACLVILFHHFKPHLLPSGWMAVDLFFLLSGYLITSIILRNSGEPLFLLNFYVRRGLRIWPIYYLTILILVLATPVLPQANHFGGLANLLTYTQHIQLYWSDRAPTFSPYLHHTWSLAVEEQFYLLWPALVCLVGKRGIIPLSLGLAAVSVGMRSCGFHWWLMLSRDDGLALGALLAAVVDRRSISMLQTRASVRCLAGLGLTAMVYLVVLTASGGMATLDPPRWPGLTVLAVNLLGLSIVGLALAYQGKPCLRVLRNRHLVNIGQLSYGLYLYHYIFMLLSDDLARLVGLGGRPVWREALTVALIFGLAKLSWRFVEQPLLSLKNRFEYRA